MIIGYYSIANAVTLFGLLSAVTSCFLAANGEIKYAVYMLFIASVCDMCDGRLARSTPNRTPRQISYGIQLDSLCDVVSFGVAPCYIAYSFGFDGGFDVFIYGLFILCGAIRLAYFNTLAIEKPGKAMKNFRGVPIPVSSFVTLFLVILTTFIPANVMVWFFRIFFIILALGFVLNIRIKKPDAKKSLIFLGVQVVLVLILLISGDCKLPVEEIAAAVA